MRTSDAGAITTHTEAAKYVSQEQQLAELNRQLARQRVLDVLFRRTTLFFALFVLAMLAAIIGSLIYGGYPAIEKFGLGFLTSRDWNPVTHEYGALNAIYGTVVTSIIALLIGVPLSFGIAIFLTELCPAWLKQPLGTAVELLAGIPSIIYGIWGLFVFAPLFGQYVQPFLTQTIGKVPIIGALFQGAPTG
ncbi:MAG: hypothetical protein ABL931_10650, partial [Usitatibacteraceae bacterium]